MNLKPCQCGKTPTGFFIHGWPNSLHVKALPNCCDEVYNAVSVYLGKMACDTTFNERQQLAVKAWNELPRREVQP